MEGRFYAEDAVVYFRQAWLFDDQWYVFTNPDLGYYSLLNRIAGFVSVNWVSLENAPRIHCWLAFFVLLIPIAVVLFSEIRGIDTPLKKIAAIMIILVSIPNSETWLSLALSQFHHGLAVALIAVSFSKHLWMRWLRCLVVLTAGFNTPFPGFLVPFIWIAWFANRRSDKLVESVILTLSTAIQAWIVLAIPDAGYREINTSFVFLPYALWIKQFLLPFGGWNYADLQVQEIRLAFVSGKELLLWAVPAIYFLIIAWLVKSRNWTGVILLLASVYLVVLSNIFGIGLDPESRNLAQIDVVIGGRYHFVPNILFFLTLLTVYQTANGKWTRLPSYISSIVISWIIVVGLINYFPEQNRVDHSFTHGTAWKEEVERWREDPEHRLRVWPKGWDIQLPPRED